MCMFLWGNWENISPAVIVIVLIPFYIFSDVESCCILGLDNICDHQHSYYTQLDNEDFFFSVRDDFVDTFW